MGRCETGGARTKKLAVQLPSAYTAPTNTAQPCLPAVVTLMVTQALTGCHPQTQTHVHSHSLANMGTYTRTPDNSASLTSARVSGVTTLSHNVQDLCGGR